MIHRISRVILLGKLTPGSCRIIEYRKEPKKSAHTAVCVCVCMCVCERERERYILRVCMWCCSERDDARGTRGGRRTTHLLPWRQHQSLTRVPRRVSASTCINTSKRGSIIMHSLHKLVKFASWLLFLLIAAFLSKKKSTNDDDGDDDDDDDDDE